MSFEQRDLSPATTVVAFDPVLPLIRVPVQAGTEDDASKGPYVLSFKDKQSWYQSWRSSELTIYEQCEAGAMKGCSISATKVCSPPWWHNLLPLTSTWRGEKIDREGCEEAEMAVCMKDAKESCAAFARDTCKAVFADVRIAESTEHVDPRFLPKVECVDQRFLSPDSKWWNSKPSGGCSSEEVENSSEQKKSNLSEMDSPAIVRTNFRGAVLMGNGAYRDILEGVVEEKDKSTTVEWDGGLIRPMVPGTKLEAVNTKEEVQSSSVESVPFWRQVEFKLKPLFEKLRGR